MHNVLSSIIDRLGKALGPLNPDIIQFIDYEESFKGRPLIQVVIVASGLGDIRTSTRWRICEDLISQRDPELAENYGFAWEAFTPREYSLIRHHKHKLH